MVYSAFQTLSNIASNQQRLFDTSYLRRFLKYVVSPLIVSLLKYLHKFLNIDNRLANGNIHRQNVKSGIHKPLGPKSYNTKN